MATAEPADCIRICYSMPWSCQQVFWSPLRGFARTEGQYKSLLQAADEHRRGDLDGRGNLTQAGLVNWIHYVLDMCLDQVQS
jgi:hypothetical protein